MQHQISLFDNEPLTQFEENLTRGSLLQGGKYRIYGASINLPTTEFAKFLKEEYGLGGFSYFGGFMDFNSDGARMREWESAKEETYSWAEVAKIIKHLISIDKYLSEEEKEYMKQLQEYFNGIPCPRPRYGYGEGWM